MKTKLQGIALSAMLMFGTSSAANASIYNITFDGLADGGIGANPTNVQETGSGLTFSNFLATLTYNNDTQLMTLGSISGLPTGTSIKSIAINLGSSAGFPLPTATIGSTTGGSGVTSLTTVSNGAGQDQPYDFPGGGANTLSYAPYTFRYDFVGGDVVNGETLSFVSNFDPNCLTSSTCAVNSSLLNPFTFAIYVTASGNGNVNSAWVLGQTVDNITPIPEAETSAMFLAGLGLLGFVSRRRKQA